MTICRIATCVGLTALAGTLLVSSEQPVHALTMKECSAKYQAAKAAGTLGGQNWRDFRKAECGAAASAGSTFCSGCGANLRAGLSCAACGAVQKDPNARFCNSCGKALTT